LGVRKRVVKKIQISCEMLGKMSLATPVQMAEVKTALLGHSGGQLMTFDHFSERIKTEFVTGSGIGVELFHASVHLVKDIETGAGGEVSAPLHEALNWRYTRFGQRSRDSLFGALLLNADGSTWQAKLSKPRTNAKGKSQKYETPVGNGSKAFLPEVPPEIRKLIGLRYGVEVPLTGNFWDWFEQHPEIPCHWKEGGKKALCLLSQGYVAIALYGVNGGYRRQVDGSRILIPDVARFAQAGRSHVLVFDQDTQPETRRRVNVAIARFGSLLEQSGGNVKVTAWDAAQGKGVDDLIVNAGLAAFEEANQQALSLSHWKISQRFQNRLTHPAQVRLSTADLSTLKLESLPNSGIIGIASAKGTGKTKFLNSLEEGIEKVLSATHRIALGRNLCSRLGLNWRGDLDKLNGDFISGSGYTLRVGFCVDSLLAIDTEKFRGCDLVLDEAIQVIRHLLTSSTCARDGKRPALLARFQELIQVARRVVAADADLDNNTLSYLQELRQSAENTEPVFLIRNDFQSTGYDVTFIDSPDRTAIASHLLTSIGELKPGKVIFVATDNKGTSKALTSIILKSYPLARVLTINSETSSGLLERELMESPDPILLSGRYDVIIASPSMATGISFEAQQIIAKVYGVFTGVSATDGDMAQALARVREPVDRIVWCAKTGTNYSRVSRSPYFLRVKNDLQQMTSATTHLICSGLRDEVVSGLDSYDYRSNPHLNLFCRMSADQNFSMLNLRDALLVRLRLEGNLVTVQAAESNPIIKLLLCEIREEMKLMDAETLVSADDLTIVQVLALEQKEITTLEEQRAIAKYHLKEFYGIEALTVENVLWDNEGRRRSEIVSLEVLRSPQLATDRTIRALEKQFAWGKGVCPWDISTLELRRAMLEKLGMTDLVDRIIKGWTWTKHDLKPFADVARQFKEQIKTVLHFTINDRVSDTQIVHQLLCQFGLKFERKVWSIYIPNHEGEKLRVYGLNIAHWEAMSAILQRRQEKRNAFESGANMSGSAPCFKESYSRDDLEASQEAELLKALKDSRTAHPQSPITPPSPDQALELAMPDRRRSSPSCPPPFQRTS
jgi:Domain of unknown function (DUF3854)